MLCVVTRGCKTIVTNKEIFHIDRVTRFYSNIATPFIESAPYFKLIVNTARFSEDAFYRVRVGVVHVHPNSIALAKTAGRE